MKKYLLLVTALLLAVFLSITTPVSASTPTDVTIISIMHPQEDPTAPYSGTFEASGPAVDAGLLCSAGTVQDIVNPARGWQSNQIISLYVHKHFTCYDGNGFEMDMRVLIAPKGTTARWIITSGDGPYTRLFGNGNLTAAWLDDALQDTYFGKLHVD